jgi:hypothetical protein
MSDLLTENGFDTAAKIALRRKVLNRIYPDSRAWARLWRYTDAYGTPGYLPAQGHDWSGFRDSSYHAIQRMADALKITVTYTGPEHGFE